MMEGITTQVPAELRRLSRRVDEELDGFLRRCAGEAEVTGEAAGATALIEETARLIAAGGKRLRPAFCYWGYRAGGGEDGEAIVRASAAMELLHTMALVHDDLIDGTVERRGEPTTRPWMAAEAPTLAPSVDPAAFGWAAAVLTGDLAAVLADRLLLESGFAPEALSRALEVYHRMRIRTAVGQFLDVSGRAAAPDTAREVARLKGGAYTVEGPLLVGAALAGAEQGVQGPLEAFGRSLGEAFQLHDDLRDRDAAPGVTAEAVAGLVERAREDLAGAPIAPPALEMLDAMARFVTADE